MTIAWITDPHFDAAPPTRYWMAFIDEVKASQADEIIISGDISDGDSIIWLEELLKSCCKPISFVLGNHDYYGYINILGVRSQLLEDLRVVNASRSSDMLLYLSESSALGDAGDYIIGVDGWGDARLGNLDTSVVLSDFTHIPELKGSPEIRNRTLQYLGLREACRLNSKLECLPTNTKRLLVVTHVPPFKEATWYRGGQQEEDFLPFFTCHAVGEVLRSYALSNKGVDIKVICGHTHNGGTVNVLDNLKVYTGAAEQGRPRICGLFDEETWEII